MQSYIKGLITGVVITSTMVFFSANKKKIKTKIIKNTSSKNFRD